jgi:hypothetical protein
VEDKPNGNPIENNADSDALQSTEPRAHIDGIKEPKQEADKPKTNKQESHDKQLSRTQRIWLWMKVKAEKAGLHDWLMVLFTAVLAFFAASQFAVSCSSSKQTADLIAAANTQATAARGFAGSADKINTGIGNAVGKLDAQATATENARKSSVDASDKALQGTIDNFHQDERAWMGVSEVIVADPSAEKGFPITVVFTNTGKTPARNVKISSGYNLSFMPITGPSSDEIGRLTFTVAQSVAPQAKLNDILGYRTVTGGMFSQSALAGVQDIRSKFQNILDGTLTLYYYGTVKYDDVFGNHRSTNFCIYLADAKIKMGAFCRDFNDLN